jgi:hypothetical protein
MIINKKGMEANFTIADRFWGRVFASSLLKNKEENDV